MNRNKIVVKQFTNKVKHIYVKKRLVANFIGELN